MPISYGDKSINISYIANKKIINHRFEYDDTEKYTPIKSFIDSELKKLDDFASEKTAPYKANLFANQEYCDVIMNAVTEAKKALQDTQVELDKKRSRYQ